jgi:hypothetical protein
MLDLTLMQGSVLTRQLLWLLLLLLLLLQAQHFQCPANLCSSWVAPLTTPTP